MQFLVPGGDEIRILQGGDRGDVFGDFWHIFSTYIQNFAACGGQFFNTIFTTACLAQNSPKTAF